MSFSNVIKIFYPAYYPSVSTDCQRYPTLHASYLCPYPGTMVEILSIIMKQANLEIQPVTALDLGYGLDELNFIGPDLYNLVENGTVDMVAQSLIATKTRAERFDFSDPIYLNRNYVVHKAKVSQYEQIWSFFYTYDSMTWIALATAWLLQLMFCLVTQRFEARLGGCQPLNVVESAFQVLRIQLMQPDKTLLQFRSMAGKFSLLIFSLVQCSILLGVFSSFVLANLIKPSFHQRQETINTIIDSLKKKEFYVTESFSTKGIFELINTSLEFPYKELNEAMKNNPLQLKTSVKEVIEAVDQDHGLLFGQDDDRAYYYTLGHCELYSTEVQMLQTRDHLMLRKNSTFLKQINKGIAGNHILFSRIMNKYLKRAQLKTYCDSRNIKPLKLIPYTGLFFVCMTIVLISFLTLFIEFLSKRH